MAQQYPDQVSLNEHYLNLHFQSDGDDLLELSSSEYVLEATLSLALVIFLTTPRNCTYLVVYRTHAYSSTYDVTFGHDHLGSIAKMCTKEVPVSQKPLAIEN